MMRREQAEQVKTLKSHIHRLNKEKRELQVMASKQALGHSLSKKKGNSSANDNYRNLGHLNSDITSQASKFN